MSSFSLHIATDGAAFWRDDDTAQDYPGDCREEVARILRATAERIEHGNLVELFVDEEPKVLLDVNGNTCGRAFWTHRDATHDDGAALDRIRGHIAGLGGWQDEPDPPTRAADALQAIAACVKFTGRRA